MAKTMTVATPASAVNIAGRRSKADRLFYVVAAGMMLIVTAGGFRNFYLHGRAPWGELTHQIIPLIVIHGLAMSGWVILFLVQSILIVTGNRRFHVAIGPLGGVLAAGIVILGTTVAPLSVRFSPQLYTTLGGPKPFLATMFVEVLSFGTLVGIGLMYRRRPEIHRPMMLLATIVMLSGAMGRFPYLETLAGFAPLYVWGPVLLFGGFLFVLQWVMSKTPNRWYLMGYAGVVMACFLSLSVGHTALWDRMMSAFAP
ncbi:MAG: hypothetical protein WBR26_07250 [Candidatus Acidiferrum sp.]